MSERLHGFRGEFLWEWDIAERQLSQLASAFPEADYEWRPDPTARSVSEVLIHISCGTFMLLEWLGVEVPTELADGSQVVATGTSFAAPIETARLLGSAKRT